MSWTRKQILFKAPPGVKSAAENIGQVADAALLISRLLKSTLDTLSSLTVVDLTLTQLAIKAAVESIEHLLKTLLEDTGAYVLMVPVARRTPIPAVLAQQLSDLGLKQIPLPPADAPYAYAQGGNAGFMRLVAESVRDEGDPNRPQFGETEHVAGLYLVAGAANLTDLAPFITQLNALLGPLAPVNTFVRPGLPVPTGLRVKLAAGATRPVALVEWEPQALITEVPSLNTHALIHQVAIVRSTDPSLLGKHTFQEIFGTAKIAPGLRAGDAEVVAVIDEDAVQANLVHNSYRDESSHLDLFKDYYYAAGYNVKVGTFSDLISGGGKELGFTTLSSVERVFYEVRAASSAKSTPPDWVRTPSVIGIVPQLRDFVDDAMLYVEQWGHVASGYTALLKDYAAWLGAQIQRYTDLAERTALTVQTLTKLLESELPVGVYTRGFATSAADVKAGRGGVEFMLEDLSNALAAEEGRPPFDHGDEFVTGLVVLVGAPSQAALLPAQRALDLLFSTTSTQANLVRDAVRQIGDLLDEGERAYAEDLKSLPAPPRTSDVATDPWSAPIPEIDTADDTTLGPWPEVPTFEPLGEADTGNCPLIKKPADPTPIEFGDDLQPL